MISTALRRELDEICRRDDFKSTSLARGGIHQQRAVDGVGENPAGFGRSRRLFESEAGGSGLTA